MRAASRPKRRRSRWSWKASRCAASRWMKCSSSPRNTGSSGRAPPSRSPSSGRKPPASSGRLGLRRRPTTRPGAKRRPRVREGALDEGRLARGPGQPRYYVRVSRHAARPHRADPVPASRDLRQRDLRPNAGARRRGADDRARGVRLPRDARASRALHPSGPEAGAHHRRGDGGALEEALKHPLEAATLVEIDEAVVRTSREYLSGVAGRAFEDSRANLVIGDGIAYAGETSERFDVVMVDSTDPQGPAVGLFAPEFYGTIARRLTPNGLLVVQSGSAIYQGDLIRSVRRTLRPFFPVVRTYVAAVVEYPGTLWSFTVGSLGPDPLAVSAETIAKRTEGFRLRYYTPVVHRAAFDAPPFLREATESDT